MLLLRDAQAESKRVRGTQEDCSAMGLTVSSFMVMEFQVVSGQSLWLQVLPGGTCIAQPKMDSNEEDSGRLAVHMGSPFDLFLMVACYFPVPYQDFMS